MIQVAGLGIEAAQCIFAGSFEAYKCTSMPSDTQSDFLRLRHYENQPTARTRCARSRSCWT